MKNILYLARDVKKKCTVDMKNYKCIDTNELLN